MSCCLVSWGYGALAQAGNLGGTQSLAAFGLTALPAAGLLAASWPGVAAGAAILGAVVWKGLGLQIEEKARQRRLMTSILVGLGLRLLPFDASMIYSLGIWMLFAWNRRLPDPPGASPSGLACAMQRLAAHCSSMVETLRYLFCFPILFVLALPSIMQFEFQGLAWKWLEKGRVGVPIAVRVMGSPGARAERHGPK